MNLGDYIGDTRTDSLPPGFLKSIKIKYRHEASHVFTGLQPWKNEKDLKRCESLADESSHRRDLSRESGKEDGSQSKEQDGPSFMNWRVPSRLLNQKHGKTLVADNKTEGSDKAKSASIVSRRTTASTVRSLTSTSLKRNEKSAEKNKFEGKIEDRSQERSHNAKEDDYKTSSGKSSNRSKCSKKDEKQSERSETNVKSVKSKILKPIALKLDEDNATAFKAKESVQNKTESRENSENLNQQRTDEGTKMKKEVRLKSQENVQAKNPKNAKSSKEKIPSVNGGMKVDERVKSEDGDKKTSLKNANGIDEKKFSNRSLKHVVELEELPKSKGLMSECTQNSPQKKNAPLPVIKPSEKRASIKLSHTPQRMGKIFDWVSKSTGREREAAFNLLSTYNKKIEAKTAKKKERVRIALQVLERKRIPDSIKPLHLNNVKRNPTALRFDQRAIGGHSRHVDKKETEGKKTWHHIAMYKHVDNSNNRSALFVQASNPYQHHFSIHPEWGLHTSVKFTNAVTT